MVKKKPKLGVYLLNFNYADFVNWAIRSIARQTLKPDVFIIVDDCSTDNSIKVIEEELKRMKRKPDDVILNDKNIGAVKSMNKAVDYLTEKGCDIVCGISADDIFHEDYLKLAVSELRKAPKNVGYCYSWVKRIGDEQSIDKHPEFDSSILMQGNFVNGSAVIWSWAWKAVDGLRDIKMCEDWDMFKRMALKGIIGKLIPKPLVYWRKHNLQSRTVCGLKGIEADGIERKANGI